MRANLVLDSVVLDDAVVSTRVCLCSSSMQVSASVCRRDCRTFPKCGAAVAAPCALGKPLSCQAMRLPYTCRVEQAQQLQQQSQCTAQTA